MTSFDDWDFSNVNWLLDDSIYHDAPPSFTGSAIGFALVKDAATGALSDGRLVTWVRSSAAARLCYLQFRNQIADGGSDIDDCYYLDWMIGTSGIRLIRRVGGGTTIIDTKTYTWTWAINTWYKVRITWWTAAERLFVRTERWTGTEWVTLGGNMDDDFEDPADQFEGAAVNRCGVFYDDEYHYDDLEVWG